MNIEKIKATLSPTSELWHCDLSQYSWLKRKLLFLARVVRLVARGFMNDQCNLHASALTYYTLMSLIPLLALGLSLARVFGGGDLAREKITAEINVIGQQHLQRCIALLNLEGEPVHLFGTADKVEAVCVLCYCVGVCHTADRADSV